MVWNQETPTGAGGTVTFFLERSLRYLGRASFQDGMDTPKARSFALESTEFAGPQFEFFSRR